MGGIFGERGLLQIFFCLHHISKTHHLFHTLPYPTLYECWDEFHCRSRLYVDRDHPHSRLEHRCSRVNCLRFVIFSLHFGSTEKELQRLGDLQLMCVCLTQERRHELCRAMSLGPTLCANHYQRCAKNTSHLTPK